MNSELAEYAFIAIAALALAIFFGKMISLTKAFKRYTTSRGISYLWYHIEQSKIAFAESKVAVETDNDIEFALLRETWSVRLAEKLGFTKKFQSGDTAFDVQVYVESEDPQFCARLHNSPGLREAVLKLLGMDVQSVALHAGKLVATLKNSVTFSQLDENIVTQLDNLKKQLPQAGPLQEQAQTRVSSARFYMKLFQGLFVVMFGLGIISSLYTSMQSSEMVQPLSLMLPAGGVVISVLIMTLVIINILFHGSSLGYEVLRTFVLYGVLGISLCAYVALYNLDIRLDKSVADVHLVHVVGKYTADGGRGSTNYYLQVEDWRNTLNYQAFRVRSGRYYAATIGNTMNVYTHPGYLGYEWVEQIHVVTQ